MSGLAAPSIPQRSRAPGSFAALPPPSPRPTTPQIRQVDSSDSDDESVPSPNIPKRSQARPFFSQTNSSTGSLQNFSRPKTAHTRTAESVRTASPLTLPPRSVGESFRTHSRKHSNSAGLFESSISSSASIQPGLGTGSGSTPSPAFGSSMAPSSNLSASQIAAQAAMQHMQHSRQRSQTLPLEQGLGNGQRKGSRGGTGPTSPPLLSLTEASGERPSGFGGIVQTGDQIYRNGLLGGGTSAATAAANVVFSRSPQTSPGLPPNDFRQPPAAPVVKEKTKNKLFSRPGKIGIGKASEKPLGSPAKIGVSPYSMGEALRGQMSTTSLAESTMSGASSMYSMTNSSSATIRPIDVPPEKEKDKKHHFLSRQKHKLSSKDDYHLPLSSAASNSRPVDPSAPSSLYNFDLPPSPGPSVTSFSKTMSGLDLRHGGRALREKKKEEKYAAGSQSALRENETIYGSEYSGPSSVTTGIGDRSYLGPPSGMGGTSLYGDTPDLGKYGLQGMTPDDAWPFLRAKLLNIFEGEDLRLQVEDFNKLVTTHIQRQIQKRSPNIIVDDLRDLLATGFGSLDQTLRRTPDDKLMPHLVEMWTFTFTHILPYMQAVFLPMDLEFSGHGPLMSEATARDFWGALPVLKNSSDGIKETQLPAGSILEVRRIVLTSYRDTVILPRFETLQSIFSRLSLESINSNINIRSPLPVENLSSSPDSFNTGGRPGTAMSLDPSLGSYNSQSTTLLGGGDSSGARSRAISNVSYGSDPSTTIPFPRLDSSNSNPMPPPPRPFTPSSTHPSLLGLGLSLNTTTSSSNHSGGHRPSISSHNSHTHSHSILALQREANDSDSKAVTEAVGRMLQCMAVLAAVGAPGAENGAEEVAQGKMEELCRALKLNWLGRGRTGRNRRGFVGGRRVARGDSGAAGAAAGGVGMGMGMGSML